MILLVDLVLIPAGFLFMMCTFLYLKLTQNKKVREHRNLMILSPSGYESIKNRGIEHLTSLDNDFFDKVYFVCPGSKKHHDVQISARMKIIDAQYPQWIKIFKLKGLKYFVFLLSQAYYLLWLSRFVIQKKIGIVRSMEPHDSGLKGILLKHLLGTKHVQDIRANFDLIFLGTGHTVWIPIHFPMLFKKISRCVEKKFEGIIYRNSDFVFGGNKNNLDYAIYCGAKLEKSAVVRVNIQPDLFDDTSTRENIRSTLDANGKIIAYCGRLSPEKYPEDVLSAFEDVVKHRPDTSLFIVGEGPKKNELVQLVSQKNLDDNVKFLGFKDNQYLKNLFTSIDAMICPLAGSVLIEGALAELPIVAYDFEWHSEVIVDAYSGLLVQFRNIRDLTRAIIYLIDNPEKAATYGKRAREITFSLLFPQHIINKEKFIYQTILEKSRQ